MPLRFEVPYVIWDDERTFARWLWVRNITGFIWEVVRYPDRVVMEIIE